MNLAISNEMQKYHYCISNCIYLFPISINLSSFKFENLCKQTLNLFFFFILFQVKYLPSDLFWLSRVLFIYFLLVYKPKCNGMHGIYWSEPFHTVVYAFLLKNAFQFTFVTDANACCEWRKCCVYLTEERLHFVNPFKGKVYICIRKIQT